MRVTIPAGLAAAILIAAAAAHHGMPSAHAAEQSAQRVGQLVVEQAWARQPLGANGAAYVTVRNEGDETDRLVAVSTDVAERAELHTQLMEDGVVKMRPVDGVDLHPGEPAVMRPGGDHIMLMGLTRTLERGDRFPLTLRFEAAGEIEVTVRVAGPGAAGPEGGADGGAHDGMDHGEGQEETE